MQYILASYCGDPFKFKPRTKGRFFDGYGRKDEKYKFRNH